MDIAARLAVAALLAVAAAAKARTFDATAEALAAHGVAPRLRRPTTLALATAEAVLAGILVSGLAPRATSLAALALAAVFVAVLARARLAGARRLPCGCFGARERPAWFLLARAGALAGLAATAAFAPGGLPSRPALVLAALVLLLLAVAVLGALVFALYRQVGVLTLRLGPGVALELAEEGPPLGEPAPSLARLAGSGSEVVAFFSAGCRLCRELAPGVRALAREGLPVHVLYEEEDPAAFEAWRVPGTPFVVHVVDGVVRAKGTANTLEQLDGLLAAGRARTSLAVA
jgi:hypothetical protein